MRIQRQHGVGIFIPALLLLSVVAVDLELFSVEMLPFVPGQLREVILGVGLALFFALQQSVKLAHMSNEHRLGCQSQHLTSVV